MYHAHDYVLSGTMFTSDIPRLVQQIHPQRTLSIRAVATLGQDLSFEDHIGRSLRSLYQVDYPDGGTAQYRRLVRLINGISKHAPEFIPDLYHTLLYEYINHIDETLYSASIYMLDYAHVPNSVPLPELELFHQTTFADTAAELCYRELFYECNLLQAEHYTIVTTPLRQQLDTLFLQQHFKQRTGFALDNENDTPVIDYLLLRRYIMPPKRPRWSRKLYQTLLHDWAQMIDQVVDTLRQK